jgi:type VI protein secretion system component VasK
VIWLIVLLAVVLALIGATMAATRMRSASLKQRFGSEYDRSLDQEGDRHRAEAVLRERARQRDGVVIRDLTPTARARYTEQWYVVQARFVDDPRQTLAEAAELVALVMHERGYPVDGTGLKFRPTSTCPA